MPPSVQKRQKERDRQERQREKDARRQEKRKEKAEKPATLDGVDPDIAHIVPGEQPPPLWE